MENRTKGERDGLLVRTSGGERTQSLASPYSLTLLVPDKEERLKHSGNFY